MSDEKTFLITTQPGIQRDGTTIDTNRYNDGEWVRFQREAGRPKKIGGYRAVSSKVRGEVRGMYSWSRGGKTEVLCFLNGGESSQQITIDKNGTGASQQSRAFIGVGLDIRQDYLWQIDSMYDSKAGSNKTMVFAHPGANLFNLDNDEGTHVYYAILNYDQGLSQDGDFHAIQWDFEGPTIGTISGGLVCLAPFLVLYGSDGEVKWSNENEPTNFVTGSAGTARITGSKIVRGMALRGGGQSPAALLWSLDSVYRMYYVGGQAIFKFDPITTQSSVLSSNGFVEYDGKYYWIGADRFLVYNGTVNELPNTTNLNFFFDNLNFEQRQKVWATKVTRYGEIWWHFPKGNSTECDHAIIYNVRLNCWYDTPIDRVCGDPAKVFHRPLWVENHFTTGDATVWVQEEGTDKTDENGPVAINSFFETSDFGFPTGGSDSEKPIGANRWTRVTRIEPDFVMEGGMTVEVTGNEFAQVPAKESNPLPFTKETGKIDMREQRREIRLRFTSNDLGGNYEAGKIIMHLDVGDIRS